MLEYLCNLFVWISEEPAGAGLVLRGFFFLLFVPSCQLVCKNKQFFCLEMCGASTDTIAIDTAPYFSDSTTAVQQDAVLVQHRNELICKSFPLHFCKA